MQNSFHKFTSDVLIIGGANVLNALSGFIFLPIITKTLGEQTYGLWSQINTVTALFLGFVGLGMPYALVRFLPAKRDNDKIKDDFYSVLVLVFLSTLVFTTGFIIAAEPVAHHFFDGETNIVRITGLIIIAMSANYTMMSYLRSFRQLKLYAVYSIIDVYCQIGVITILVLNGQGIMSMALSYLSIKVVLGTILFLTIRRQRGLIRPHFTRTKEYIKFGLSTIPLNICSWVINTSSRLIIAYFLGISAVGIYSAAFSTGNAIHMISAIIGLVLTPSLAKLYDEKKIDELKMLMSYVLKYILTLCIPFLFGAAMLSYQVLDLLSTPEIASQGQYVLIIQAVSAIILLVSTIFNQVLVLTLNLKILFIPWIIAAATNIVLNLLLVPWIGIIGSSLGTLASFLILSTVTIYYSRKDLRFHIHWIFIIKCFIAAGIMAVVIWIINPQTNTSTIISIVTGIVIYGIVIILLRGFSKSEFGFFLNYCKTIIKKQ